MSSHSPLSRWQGMDPRIGSIVALYGREGNGEGGGSGTPPTPPSGEGSGTPPTPSTDGEKKESKPETFDRAYVEKIRAEAADYRTKFQALEKEKTEREKAEMSELDRLKAEKEEADARIKASESLLLTERKRNAILTAAGALKFRDPEDAIAHINLDDITMNQDGSPHKGSVEAAVKKVAEAKKYLISGIGSADGGARGNPPPPDDAKLRQYEQEIADMGGVKVNI